MNFKGLFIGIDRYVSKDAPWLNCAIRDAKAFHALFTNTLGGDTKLLANAAATKKRIEEELEVLSKCKTDEGAIPISGLLAQTC
jgi:helicase